MVIKKTNTHQSHSEYTHDRYHPYPEMKVGLEGGTGADTVVAGISMEVWGERGSHSWLSSKVALCTKLPCFYIIHVCTCKGVGFCTCRSPPTPPNDLILIYLLLSSLVGPE